MCSFGGGEYLLGEDYFEDTVRARVARPCAECLLPIPAGERHRRILFCGDGCGESSLEGTCRFFLHRACAKLAPRAAEVACGVYDYPVGELLEHVDALEEVLRAELMGETADLYDDPVDPAEAWEILRGFAAIEQRYSGDEYDLGGEG